MGKEHQVVRELEEQLRRAGTSRAPHRLYYPSVRRKFRLSYEKVAKLIRDDSEVHDYFLDTNFITAHEVPSCVWEQLSKKRITITGLVWKELEPWRNNPKHNASMVATLLAAVDRKNPNVLLDSESKWGIPIGICRGWYTDLLAQRKRKAVELVDEFKEINTRNPTQNERNHLFQKGFNSRDITIFQKGWSEIVHAGNIFTDEELVATAATIAFGVGKSVTILTRDHDVFEQFYKITELMTKHYQATLFAEKFAADPRTFSTMPMPVTPVTDSYFFAADSILVKKPVPPDNFLYWLLPSEFTPVRLRCVLFTGEHNNMFVNALSFVGEANMLALVEAKGESWGLNTAKLGGRNCHVTGFPCDIPNPRDYAIVCRDKELRESTGRFHFPILDIAHSVYHFGVAAKAEPAS